MEIIIRDACMREQVAVGIALPVEIMACQQEAQYSFEIVKGGFAENISLEYVE